MIQQTKAYRAALAQLAGVIAQQDPADVQPLSHTVMSDLSDVIVRRHPEFDAATTAVYEAGIQRRKQEGIDKRRATLRRKRERSAGN